MTATPRQPDSDTAAEARSLIRCWVGMGEGDMLRSVDAIGRTAIRNAGEASRRLDRVSRPTRATGPILDRFDAVMNGAALSVRRRGSWFRRREPTPTASDAELNSILELLDREHDEIARDLIALETDRRRLGDAEEAMEDAVDLVCACTVAAGAAARELASTSPDLAAFIRGEVTGRLIERERDILLQAAVTRQGVLALDLVVQGQQTALQAVARARAVSAAALRTAVAARRIAADRET